MRTMRLLLALWFLVAPLEAARAADGLRVEPGLWEFRSSLPDVLTGDTPERAYRTCVRERSVTPAIVMRKIPECRISSAVVQGANAKWKMRCDTPVGPVDGRGSLRSSGSAVTGSLEMTVVLGSFEIPATGEFRGRRIGNCR